MNVGYYFRNENDKKEKKEKFFAKSKKMRIFAVR